MKHDAQHNPFMEERPDEEGLFDAQMSLPLAAVPWGAPVREIVKRDGRREPFDKSKIAAAMIKAAPRDGAVDPDTADGIASAVAIYLSKRLDGEPATADQVSDAVERVLIQMTQAETALAYARYRDRRARIRRLRKGDMQALLSELEEAQHERDASLARDMTLHVQTSRDTLMEWDRSRIVEALRLETGMEPGLAAIIAAEVEKQIQGAGISILTAALVRELVGAKLIEHGLADENERRRRLGVPLYDASRIIRGCAAETLNATPGITDGVLARAVKKEYALAEVFSTPVTQAHLLGQIHLGDAEYVDRLSACMQFPTALALRLSGTDEKAPVFPPGAAPFMGVSLLMKQHDFLQTFFSGIIGWQAFNFLAAPFMHGVGDAEMQAFARMFVDECASRGAERGVPTRIALYWSVPSWLRAAQAETYATADWKALEPVARSLFAAFLEVYKEGASTREGGNAPVLELVLEQGLFKTFEGNACLSQAARAVLERPDRIRFALDEAPAGERDDASHVREICHDIVWHRVALNLPRAAVATRHKTGFWAELDRLCSLVVSAHAEKRRLIESMLDPDACGPLGGLARFMQTDGEFDTSRGCFAVDADGLFECAEIMLGANPASFNERLRFMHKTLTHLDATLRRLSVREGMTCTLAANCNAHVSRRFAGVDAGLYPRLMEEGIRTEPESQVLTYTTGVGLPAYYALNPVDIARIEGGLHKKLASPHFARVAWPVNNAAEGSVVDLLKKVFHHSECAGLAFMAPVGEAGIGAKETPDLRG